MKLPVVPSITLTPYGSGWNGTAPIATAVPFKIAPFSMLAPNNSNRWPWDYGYAVPDPWARSPEMLDDNLDEVVDEPYTMRQLRNAFSTLVAGNKAGDVAVAWKLPVDTMIYHPAFPIFEAAASWFGAGQLRIQASAGVLDAVHAPGYYATIGA